MFDTAKMGSVDEMVKVFNHNPYIISSIYIDMHDIISTHDMSSVIIAFNH